MSDVSEGSPEITKIGIDTAKKQFLVDLVLLEQVQTDLHSNTFVSSRQYGQYELPISAQLGYFAVYPNDHHAEVLRNGRFTHPPHPEIHLLQYTEANPFKAVSIAAVLCRDSGKVAVTFVSAQENGAHSSINLSQASSLSNFQIVTHMNQTPFVDARINV